MIVNDWSRSVAIRDLSELEHGIIPFIGSGKQGKSTSLHALCEICWPDQPRYILDYAGLDISIFPDYYHLATDWDDIEPDSVVILEDVNRIFSSRNSGNRADLQQILGVISHKGQKVLFSSQSLADTDSAFLRSQNLIYAYKRMWDEDISFERPENMLLQASANSVIEKAMKYNLIEKTGIDYRSWTFFPRWNECVALPQLPWWDRRHTHMLRNFRVCEAIRNAELAKKASKRGVA